MKDKNNIKVNVIGNIYPSQGQNGDIINTDGLAPCLRSGQGIKGRGIGSCNSPKIIIKYEENTNKTY